jgi:hypothetical protein
MHAMFYNNENFQNLPFLDFWNVLYEKQTIFCSSVMHFSSSKPTFLDHSCFSCFLFPSLKTTVTESSARSLTSASPLHYVEARAGSVGFFHARLLYCRVEKATKQKKLIRETSF